jgi:hypothetical protein
VPLASSRHFLRQSRIFMPSGAKKAGINPMHFSLIMQTFKRSFAGAKMRGLCYRGAGRPPMIYAHYKKRNHRRLIRRECGAPALIAPGPLPHQLSPGRGKIEEWPWLERGRKCALAVRKLLLLLLLLLLPPRTYRIARYSVRPRVRGALLGYPSSGPLPPRHIYTSGATRESVPKQRERSPVPFSPRRRTVVGAAKEQGIPLQN